MRWLPGSLATPVRNPATGGVLDRSHPSARGLIWWTDAPQRVSRTARASPIGETFTPAETQVTGPAFSVGQYSDITMLSFGVLNGTANSGNDQGGIRLGATQVRIQSFSSNAQIQANCNYNDFTNSSIGSTPHGVSTAGGILALGLRHVRGAADGVAVFVNGRILAAAAAQNKTLMATGGNITAHWAQAAGNQGYLTAFNAIWSRALSDDEMLSLSRNPWQLYTQTPRPLWAPTIVIGVTVYRPGSDIIVNGWTATPGGTLASCIDDPTLDRADYITSPNLTDPVTLGWQVPQPAGTWDFVVDADRTGASGQVRIVCLDGGGTPVGTSSWQTLTATATSYTLSVTTSATSTQFRIEVQ